MTADSKAASRCATSWPILPSPTTPTVLPAARRRCTGCASTARRRVASAAGMCRAAASSSAIACSAAETMFDVGALTTITPRAVAAGTSTLSRPTPARATTLSRWRPPAPRRRPWWPTGRAARRRRRARRAAPAGRPRRRGGSRRRRRARDRGGRELLGEQDDRAAGGGSRAELHRSSGSIRSHSSGGPDSRPPLPRCREWTSASWVSDSPLAGEQRLRGLGDRAIDPAHQAAQLLADHLDRVLGSLRSRLSSLLPPSSSATSRRRSCRPGSRARISFIRSLVPALMTRGPREVRRTRRCRRSRSSSARCRPRT